MSKPPVFELFAISVIFQAKTQAKIFLLNWAPDDVRDEVDGGGSIVVAAYNPGVVGVNGGAAMYDNGGDYYHGGEESVTNLAKSASIHSNVDDINGFLVVEADVVAAQEHNTL